MKTTALLVSMALVAVPITLKAQSTESSSRFVDDVTVSQLVDEDAAFEGGVTRPLPPPSAPLNPTPFSRTAIGTGISTFGPGLQVTTFITPHLNLRSSGSYFRCATHLTSNGLNADGNLTLLSAGVAADIYLFQSGFRVSPGILVYNASKMTAAPAPAGGSSFTLNGDTYYSATANPALGITPVHGSAELGLHTNSPAFTLTAGWGNTIPHDGGRWSVPFEAGVAFIGHPSLNASLSGWACLDQAQTECTDVSNLANPIAVQIQSDLGAQIAHWKNNLNPLGTYPIVSIGVAYSFGPRGMAR